MNTKYLKSSILTAVAGLMSAAMFVSCTADDIVAGMDGSTDMSPADQSGIIVKDGKTALSESTIDLYADGHSTTLTLTFPLAQPIERQIQLSVDTEYVAAYNAEHATEYVAFDAQKVTFENGGLVTLPANAKSMVVKMDIHAKAAETVSDEEVQPEVEEQATYMLAVAVADQSKPSTSANHCTYVINDFSKLGTANKGADAVQGYLFFEVNDVNPLNALAYELEDGRLLWNVVVLFAANINHHVEDNRPYIKCNPNVQYLLDHNEEFLQPLRKRGIKVLLGLLGNHDQAGLAQLSETGAKIFAAEVAHYCEAYNLDGVNYDNEYSKSPDLNNPCYTYPSYDAAGRLCYETKRAMPDKLTTVYDLGSMYGCLSVDGVPVDEWIDIVVPDYGAAAYPKGGMSKKKCAGMAMEFNNGRGSKLNASNAQNLLDEGWGWYMGFAPSPNKDGWPSFDMSFNRLYGGPKVLYGSDLKEPTFFYKKNDTKRYVYPDDVRK